MEHRDDSESQTHHNPATNVGGFDALMPTEVVTRMAVSDGNLRRMDAELVRRRAIQVGHSLNMIAELPHYTHDPDVPAVLRAAALDAFFVHLRLLIEFLITKPRTDRLPVISRWDYATGLGLDNALRDRLQAASDFANVHVAHFNASRVPTAGSLVTHTPSRTSLVGYRQDVFMAMTAPHPAPRGSEKHVRR